MGPCLLHMIIYVRTNHIPLDPLFLGPNPRKSVRQFTLFFQGWSHPKMLPLGPEWHPSLNQNGPRLGPFLGPFWLTIIIEIEIDPTLSIWSDFVIKTKDWSDFVNFPYPNGHYDTSVYVDMWSERGLYFGRMDWMQTDVSSQIFYSPVKTYLWRHRRATPRWSDSYWKQRCK